MAINETIVPITKDPNLHDLYDAISQLQRLVVSQNDTIQSLEDQIGSGGGGGNGFSGEYSDLSGLPSVFPPEDHSHVIADISNFPSFAVVATSGSYTDLSDKPTIPEAFSGDYNDLDNLPTLFSGNYADLSGKPSLFSGSYGDLSGVPSTFTPSAHTHLVEDITDFPTLATVATSGNYGDLNNLPTLFSGSYGDLSNVPSTFTPSSHTHAASEITSGEFTYDRLPFSSANVSSWNTSYDRSVTGVSGSGNGTITISRQGTTNVTADLSHSHGYDDLPISSAQVSNWDEAHSWGDHSQAGYSTTDTNTTYSAGTGLTLDGTEFNVDNPVTATQVSNWNEAYGWGNHSIEQVTPSAVADIVSEGRYWLATNLPSDKPTPRFSFLDVRTNGSSIEQVIRDRIDPIHQYYRYTEDGGETWAQPAGSDSDGWAQNWNSANFDPSSKANSSHSHSYSDLPISSAQVDNWDTAYGWGNHASAGYIDEINGHHRKYVRFWDYDDDAEGTGWQTYIRDGEWNVSSLDGAPHAQIVLSGHTVWHEGTFDPDSKANSSHNHDSSYVRTDATDNVDNTLLTDFSVGTNSFWHYSGNRPADAPGGGGQGVGLHVGGTSGRGWLHFQTSNSNTQVSVRTSQDDSGTSTNGWETLYHTGNKPEELAGPTNQGTVSANGVSVDYVYATIYPGVMLVTIDIVTGGDTGIRNGPTLPSAIRPSGPFGFAMRAQGGSGTVDPASATVLANGVTEVNTVNDNNAQGAMTYLTSIG